MAASIYADVPKNECSCGGEFSKRLKLLKIKKEVSYPACNSCNRPPHLLRIKARVIDLQGVKKYVYIRYNQYGERLNDIDDCFLVLKKIDQDVDHGAFDVRAYESKKTRDSFLFKNFVQSYLGFHQKRLDRQEITPYGYESKVKYTKFLVAYFGEYDISKISLPLIDEYKNAFTEKYSNRDMSLGELKTILNHALRMEFINRVPLFEVPNTRKRKSIPNLTQTREEIIPAIGNETHREAIRMLANYALRPCEVRAIQYEQIDLINNTITIDRHFSKTKLLPGRKSNPEGPQAALVRELTPKLREYITSLPRPLDGKTFLFRNSVGKPLGVKDLSQTWRNTLSELGMPHIQMYGLRGAGITQVLLETNGNMIVAKNFAGHSNIQTTMARYDHSPLMEEFRSSKEIKFLN